MVVCATIQPNSCPEKVLVWHHILHNAGCHATSDSSHRGLAVSAGVVQIQGQLAEL